MNNVQHRLFAITIVLAFICISTPYAQNEHADVVIQNGLIYTVNTDAPWGQALAIRDGRILTVGTNDEVQHLINAQTKLIDAKNNFVMPGFIEGHGHFAGLGSSLQNLNFLKSRSWQEIVDAVNEKVKDSEPGEWIIGRGWHQEKWADTLMQNVLGYPYHEALSAISPENPVILVHASGHGLMANARGMQKAGITSETPNPSGGNIVRDMNGEAIGVFEENAMGAIWDAYREYTTTLSEDDLVANWYEGIELAESECLSNGVTSFQDAGSSLTEVDRYKRLAEEGELDLRLWAMIRHTYAYLNDKLDGYPIIDAGNGYFTSRAIKLSIDGALGSYGAWLLEPYDDKPGAFGQNTSSLDELKKLATLCTQHHLQLCVDAIGDRANREVLNAYEQSFHSISADPGEFRWRVEHAQHIHPDDIPRFAQYGIIAAMQGIHCTSDAPFVEKRLGTQRAKEGAYVWQSLLKSGAVVTNGTDAPVEDVNPIESFYATVTRKRADSGMEFFTEQVMSRKEAIYSYTMANAYAAFEEDSKGSLEPGKYADIIILSEDLVRCKEEDILSTKVLMTLVGGKIKHTSANFSN